MSPPCNRPRLVSSGLIPALSVAGAQYLSPLSQILGQWGFDTWHPFLGTIAALMQRLGSELTQIEDPREQWRREQERMLKEYLIVAQEALNAKKEIYQIKQQRFELAQEEYQQLHKMCEDDSRSYASCELTCLLLKGIGNRELRFNDVLLPRHLISISADTGTYLGFHQALSICHLSRTTSYKGKTPLEWTQMNYFWPQNKVQCSDPVGVTMI
ncbi:hypothetical protein P7K49_038385 [Saguinus oedipus]|uniref:Uncharacterized protein n=1 Tax=Saguinus oedipus TaxID=9490 RepID=A0ABQ9TEJ7_SAGOE|nr:hypothetical protein P7K49_038385 [Saguinus oedipus]